jgi:hypothetical protein
VLSQQNHLRPGTRQREFTDRARSRKKAAKPPELQPNLIGNSNGVSPSPTILGIKSTPYRVTGAADRGEYRQAARTVE